MDYTIELHRALANGEDPLPIARAAVAEMREAKSYFTISRVEFFRPMVEEASLIILAGAGPELAKRVWKILRADGGKRLLARVSQHKWTGHDWENAAWLRVLAKDWRAIPPLNDTIGYLRLADLLAGVEQGDATLVGRALTAFAEDELEPPAFPLALQSILPPGLLQSFASAR